MAKQSGLVKLSGRIEGQSFYYNKNGGYLTRTINTGMSGRVKTDAAYSNTRKNNAEFGAAGASAGLIMRTIPKKFRYILQSTATGILNKAIKAQLSLDPSGLWGQRQIPSGGQQVIMDSFNALSKNLFPQEIKDYLANNLKYDSDAKKVFVDYAFDIPASLVEQLESIGADYVAISAYAMSVDLPKFNSTTKTYDTPSTHIVYTESLSNVGVAASTESTLISDVPASVNFSVINDNVSSVSGMFFVFLPMRQIGNAYNTLQEHCSALWIPATTGTAPE